MTAPTFAQRTAEAPGNLNPAAAHAPEEEDSNPEEIRRGMRMGGQDGKSREQVTFERLISQVEADLKGKPDRIPAYIALYRGEMINDVRLFPTRIEGSWDDTGTTLTLTGYVGFEENRQSLGKLFQYLGFQDVRNEVEVLPSADLGERRYAIVRAPRTFTYDGAVAPRETMNEAFVGDPVFLLKRAENDHFLCYTSEGYVGYIAADDVETVDAAAFAEYQTGPRVTLTRDYWRDGKPEPEVLRAARPSRRRGVRDNDQETTITVPRDAAEFIPAGARLRLQGDLAGDRATVLLPDGRKIQVPAKILSPAVNEAHPAAVEAVAVAETKLGSPYVWGGKSTTGVDCSGLVASAYQSMGIFLPRDAYMQAYMGKLVATRWNRDGLRPGDLLYFLGGNGKVTHTAIYVGGGQYIEASGTVKYTSLNPGDENYDERRDKGFAFAKRLFD